MYARTGQILERYGYRRYEISNYAKPGYACRHNIGYWRRTEYAGFGLGSASLADNVRWKVTDDLERYLSGIAAAGRKAPRPEWREEVHVLSVSEQMEEFLFLGLRMTEGIRLSDFRRQFGAGLREVYGSVLDKLEEQGLLVFYEDGRRMKLTARGTDLSNYVLAQFLLDGET